MLIIAHADVRWVPAMARVRQRYLVSKDQGTVSLFTDPSYTGPFFSY